MTKVNRNRPFHNPNASKHAEKMRVNEESVAQPGLYASLKNSTQRVAASVHAFFQSCSTPEVKETAPSVRASFQAQLKNLIKFCPPSEKTIGNWYAFIEHIHKDHSIGEDGVVAALEAIVYLRAYKELEQSKLGQTFIKNLSYKIAEELVQLMREQKKLDLSILWERIQQRNLPQEDEMCPSEFFTAVEKMQIDVLNSTEMKAYAKDINDGKWKRDELRIIHLINYSPRQMSKIHRILSKLDRDLRFPDLVNRLKL